MMLWRRWYEGIGARKIGGVTYGRSIARSRRPECRIVIALAELKAAGWHSMRYAPTDRIIEVIEIESTGVHLARWSSGAWWILFGEDEAPAHPIVWREARW